MRFTLVDPADPDREFSLLLDVSQDSYTGMFSLTHSTNPSIVARDLTHSAGSPKLLAVIICPGRTRSTTKRRPQSL